MGSGLRTIWAILIASMLSACIEGKFVLHLVKKQGATAPSKFNLENCVDPDLSKLSVGTKFSNCKGEVVEGTWSTHECTGDGEGECEVVGSFTAVDVRTINAIDIREGKSIAGVQGTLRLGQCRNGVANATFNSSSAPMPDNGLGNATGSADPLQWWDTVSTSIVPTAMTGQSDAWGAANFCSGTQFTDVTNTNSDFLAPTGSYNCSGGCTDAVGFVKIWHDSYTGLYITNPLIGTTACGGANECADWPETVMLCKALNSGDGAGKWRLPTQAELILLFAGGIYFVPNINQPPAFLVDYQAAATTSSLAVGSAWYIAYGFGATLEYAKNNYFAAMCVR